MRVVALEEHFTAPALVRRIDPEAIKRRGYRPRKLAPGGPNPMELAPEIGERRLQSMDEAGITVQVLSNTGPGPDLVPGADGVALAREMNDHLAEAIARRPDRFAGFAVLPMQSDTSTADELVRAVRQLRFVGALVNGTTEGRFLDHPHYRDLLAAAEELDVPIYIHPHLAPEPVRQAYYSEPGAGRGARAGGRRLGLAFGDRHPRPAPGALRRPRPASAAEAHRRPHGRDAADDAGPHRRGVRARHRAPEAADRPHHPRPGLAHDQRHLHASRRLSPRCRPSASTA